MKFINILVCWLLKYISKLSSKKVTGTVLSTLTLVGGGTFAYSLYKNEYELSNIGLIRFSRAGVVAFKVFSDYKISLYGVERNTEDYNQRIKEAHKRSAEKILKLCQLNGGTFIKMGQLIAVMEYLIPYEYTSTLCQLFSSAPITEFEDVKKMIESNLKKPMDEIFSSFECEPVGSASLGQVHIGVLKETSEKVAVKVQHPKVLLRSSVDLKTMELFATIAGKLFPEFNLMWLVDETKRNLPKELDFLHEAKNADTVRRMFSHLTYLKIPEIKYDYSTSQILTMEYCEGKQINDVEYLKRENINVHDLCSKIGRLFSEMIFSKGYIHADPHPGNLLVYKDKKTGAVQLVLLDHGLYSTLKDNFRVLYSELWLALLKPDLDEVKRVSTQMGVGDLHDLFACMITMRSWDSIQQGIKTKKKDDEEVEHIKEYASKLATKINEILINMPREMLLILKTNDLIRSIEYKLGVSSREDSFIEMARFCTKSNCQDGMNLKNKAVTRWKNYASEFFTDEQTIGMFDMAVEMAYNGSNVSDIGNSITNYLMSEATPSQFSKVTSFGLGLPFYYSGGISGFIDLTSTHLSNNLSPFCKQMQIELLKMKDEGKDKQYIYNQGYYMALNMFTPSKIEGIMCRLKKRFTPAVWTKIYSNIVKFNFIKISLYDANCV
ncbi:Serine/threonine-/dual specificity protein kinase, catalytic domain and UbiB domain and Protein kinase-like domain-containing protein [Strongyloides ratti]|uniref:Serine/threonine-/dual specificity protein kinase, catalytic domain and UbiB domain and Protein kinase-like domain-containing protein n=1 Tax=Strongyloides ratti TaxID=34506 RepID=A0A090LQ59_STRRB|nr:Serine/threonine-/dual specificity protein kinase, catalytic domain and UbiB domain and Protein kinase-like domain-containing protein [Strongyloides ratti]CEF69676.1 Serine/threonine-/dual specificity protein kinase, catalytic domain and UbiB domain and Protein kinase-like domain-containing protein [Strongyloides ratti]